MATVDDELESLNRELGAQSTNPVDDELEAINSGKVAPPTVETESAPAAPRDPNSISSTVGRGVDQFQSSLYGAGEAAASLVGASQYEAAFRKDAERNKQEAAQYGKPSNPDIQSVEDLGDFGNWAKETFLSSLPSMSTVLGAGYAASKAAPMQYKPAAFMAGMFGASLVENTGNIQNMQHELNPEGEANALTSLAGGIPVAALDAAGLAISAKPLIKTIGKDAAERYLLSQGVKRNVVKEALYGAGVGAAVDSVTGAGQAAITRVAASEGAGVETDTEALVHDAVNAAAGGFVMGSSLGTASHVVKAARDNAVASSKGPQRKAFEDETTITGKPKTEEPGLGEAFWNGIGSGALKGLEPWARVSSEMKDIIRDFRPDESGRTATKPTIFEDQRLMAGKYNTKLDELVSDAGGIKNFSKALDDHAAGNYTNPIAKRFRDEFVDPILKEAQTRGGLETGQLKNYLPFTIKAKTFKDPTLRDQFLNDITPYFQNRAAAEDAVSNYEAMLKNKDLHSVPKVRRVHIDPVTGEMVIDPKVRYDKNDPNSQKYKFSQGTRPPEFGHFEKSRAFGAVPQHILNKYAKEQTPKSRMNALRDYVEGGAHRVAFAERFGPTGDKLNARISKAAYQAQLAGRPVSKGELNRIYDVADAYNGMYGAIANPKLKTAKSAVQTAATFKVGLLFALSSLAETAAPAIRGDVTSALRAIAPVIGEGVRAAFRTIVKSTPPSELGKLMSEANLTLNAATNVAAQRLGNNAITQGAAKASTILFKLNGLSYITHATTTYAAKTGDILLMQGLKELSVGIPQDSARGRYIMNQLRSMGVEVRDAAHAKALYDPKTQAEREVSKATRVAAMTRFARQAVLEPNISDTPLWMNHGHIQILAMLKKYPTAFTNTVLPALLRKASPAWSGSYNAAVVGGMNALMIGGFMLTVGYLQDEMKMAAKGIDKDTRTDAQRLADVMSNTVSPVHVNYLTDMIFAHRFGSTPLDAMAGPAVGMGTELAGTIGKMATNPEEGAVWKYLYKQTPFQFYRPGREAASELGE